MYKNFDSHKPYFYSVALAFIIVGAFFLALGIVEWFLNYYATYFFHAPLTKIFAGLVVMGLGYIHLELEIIRTQKK